MRVIILSVLFLTFTSNTSYQVLSSNQSRVPVPTSQSKGRTTETQLKILVSSTAATTAATTKTSSQSPSSHTTDTKTVLPKTILAFASGAFASGIICGTIICMLALCNRRQQKGERGSNDVEEKEVILYNTLNDEQPAEAEAHRISATQDSVQQHPDYASIDYSQLKTREVTGDVKPSPETDYAEIKRDIDREGNVENERTQTGESENAAHVAETGGENQDPAEMETGNEKETYTDADMNELTM